MNSQNFRPDKSFPPRSATGSKLWPLCAAVFSIAAHPVANAAPSFSSETLEFFESKVRPVLATECYECHGPEKQKGGLRLDFKGGWEKGGDSGPSILPGNPKDSLLLQSVRHEDPDLKMPSKAPKLSPESIANLEKWVTMGAPDPREKPETGNTSPWSLKLAERRKWWSLQPIRNPAPPEPQNPSWSAHPVDQFLLAAMEKRGLKPAQEVAPAMLLRRLTFVLTGLSPTPDALLAFEQQTNQLGIQKATEEEVDRLMALPAFGERWARHWMDLVRYAESHGSEGDPALPEAWRYRDYLIRAWNTDLPVDQLIREHLAGDLLTAPRIYPGTNSSGPWNESAIGTAHLRMVEHGYQPVDTLDEQIKVVDNQIDVIGKAFQGLTLSCARCHDHKFDAISQQDYYAVFGILASTRPVQRAISLHSPQKTLAQARTQLRALLATAWKKEIETLPQRLTQLSPESLPQKDPDHPFYPWASLHAAQDFDAAWKRFSATQQNELSDIQKHNTHGFHRPWNLKGADYQSWFRLGHALGDSPAKRGEFLLTPGKDAVLKGVFESGALSTVFSAKAHAIFASPRFKITTNRISIRAAGGSQSQVRLIVDNYPLGNPTSLFPQSVLNRDTPGWITLNVEYRKGSWGYLEFTTAGDAPRTPTKPDKNKPAVEPDSWFAVSDVVFHDQPAPPRTERPFTETLLRASPQSASALATIYQELLQKSVTAWEADSLTDPERALLDASIRLSLLTSHLSQIPGTKDLLSQIQTAEQPLENPVRISSIADAEGIDWPLLNRGDHLQPGNPVARGYLEVFGANAFLASSPHASHRSGRIELADSLLSPQNPLTSRVLVNRLWHHVFGRGLVPSVDNFGRLGDPCSNPDLLDYLASELVKQSWSAKKMIRFLVTSRTFRLRSTPSPESLERDPANDLLSHAHLRRMDAETLRDTLLQLSGSLAPTAEGPGAAPVDSIQPPPTAYRRSVYLQSRRSVFNGLLDVFDSPKPFTTVGRRDVTNVPAQALSLLNDPWVNSLAQRWIQAEFKRQPDAAPDSRVRTLFLSSLCRLPSDTELAGSLQFLDQLQSLGSEQAPNRTAQDPTAWTRFAHTLLNFKEFLYIP